MQQNPQDLVVRQHKRIGCDLPSSVMVAERDGNVDVRLSRRVGDGAGSLPVRLRDCSGGGVGFESSVFFPRGARLLVRVPHPEKMGEALYEGEAVVQRVVMTGRAPTFMVGVAFSDPSGGSAIKLIDWVVEHPGFVAPADVRRGAAPGEGARARA